MDSIDLAFGVVAVAGVALLLYGLSLPSATGGLTVEGPLDASNVDEDDVVAYENLSSENRETFDRALDGDSEVNDGYRHWNTEAVVHDDQYYRTSPWGGENATRLFTIVGGWITTGFGIVGFVGIQAFRRWKGSNGSTDS